MKLITLFVSSFLISSVSWAANINVRCFTEAKHKKPATQLVSFEIANSPSKRLLSDLIETRATADSEVLPAFLVSQYTFQPHGLLIEMDDGSAAGNLIMRLEAQYSGKKTKEGLTFRGAYKRLDAGRTFDTKVTCFAK